MSLTTIAIVGWCAVVAFMWCGFMWWAYRCDKRDRLLEEQQAKSKDTDCSLKDEGIFDIVRDAQIQKEIEELVIDPNQDYDRKKYEGELDEYLENKQ